MTSHGQTFVVEPEWQATPRLREKMRRIADSRELPSATSYDAAALTDALCLNARPVAQGVARKIVGNYAIPYDVLLKRIRRRKRLMVAE